MSRTKYDDRIKIKEAADTLSKRNIGISHPGKVNHASMEYDFNTPVELMKVLEKMWDSVDKPYMKDFIPSVTASAFKNRDESDEVEVSPFNYQF
ncbi:MAG: hypothetical protein IJT96_02150 [Lachnospiraceae bacterium]|nr:hypothetical protein [Lachnospiraceae bacterium]